MILLKVMVSIFNSNKKSISGQPMDQYCKRQECQAKSISFITSTSSVFVIGIPMILLYPFASTK
jgi:hypothetical protein